MGTITGMLLFLEQMRSDREFKTNSYFAQHIRFELMVLKFKTKLLRLHRLETIFADFPIILL